MTSNNAVIFTKVPNGYPVPGQDLKYVERAYSLAEPQKDEIITENLYASIDPYQRGRMRDASIKSYSPPFPMNEPFRNHTIAKVHKTNNAKFKVGDLVFCQGGEWAEYTIFDAEAVKGVNKIDNSYDIPLSHFLGAV